MSEALLSFALQYAGIADNDLLYFSYTNQVSPPLADGEVGLF